MRVSQRIRASIVPLIAGLLVSVLAGANFSFAADDVYFVQRQISNSPVGGSSAMSRFDLGPPPGTGKPKTPVQPKLVNATVNRIMRSDAAGGSLKVVYETDLQVLAVSASSDGSRILCHVQATGPATAKSQPGGVVSKILILLPDGKVEKTIELADQHFRVFGTPVLLPDKKHIGLTVYKLPDVDELQKSMPTPSKQGQSAPASPPPGSRSTGPRPTDPRSAKAALDQLGPQPALQSPMGLGVFLSQPYVATIDLSGHDLKQLGPGAMPCWSPDGKTILWDPLESTCRHASLSIL